MGKRRKKEPVHDLISRCSLPYVSSSFLFQDHDQEDIDLAIAASLPHHATDGNSVQMEPLASSDPVAANFEPDLGYNLDQSMSPEGHRDFEV